MAKRLLALRSLTLESEQINILVQNPQLFTCNGTPVVSMPNAMVAFTTTTPTLDAGTITASAGTPQVSYQFIGPDISFSFKAYTVVTVAGGPANVLYLLGTASWGGGVFPFPHGASFIVPISNAGALAQGILQFAPSTSAPPVLASLGLLSGAALTPPFGIFGGDLTVSGYTYT